MAVSSPLRVCVTAALDSRALDAKLTRNILIAWAVICVIAAALKWGAMLQHSLPDPDDSMRLQQVRDLIGGQSWFDTSQHRMNPPEGAPMHWSRLVDVPLLIIILPLKLVFGQAAAELATMMFVPLVPLLLAMLAISRIAKMLVSRKLALLGAVFLPTFPLVWIQIQPLRIDHHGWQLALGVIAVAAVFHRNERLSGLVAGIAMALWTAISVESLPFVGAIGSLFALRWVIHGSGRGRFIAYTGALALGTSLIFLLTKAPSDWTATHCDSLTTPYLAAFITVAALAPILMRIAASRTIRIVVLAAIGGAGILSLGLVDPACMKGPFAALDPIVRDYWYKRVPEGLPIWRQTPVVSALVIGFPLLGLLGSIWACTRTKENRGDWISLAWLLACAIAIAVMVQRGAALANTLAIPGDLFLIAQLMPRIGQIGIMPARVLLNVAVGLLLSPWGAGIVGLSFEPAPSASEQLFSVQKQATEGCSKPLNLAKLDALPPSNLLTPLDIAPTILVSTHHTLVASGHHRNQVAMRDVIVAFTASQAKAHQIIEKRHIDYIVACPYQNEGRIFQNSAPRGLWAQLALGNPPAWLEPAAIPDTHGLIVWRVKR